MARKLSRQNFTGLQSQFNIFYSVCQSIATHMFVHFLGAHVCLSVSVDVAFHFKLGFGRDVGLSLYLDFGGLGFECASCFGGTWV